MHDSKQIRLSALARRGIGNASDKNALLEAGDFYRERAEKMFCAPLYVVAARYTKMRRHVDEFLRDDVPTCALWREGFYCTVQYCTVPTK